MHICHLPCEVIFKIVQYLDNDIDIKNLLITNKEFYKLYYYLFNFKFTERLKYRELEILFNEYFELKEVDKRDYPNIKSYMFSNSFKNNNLFICKIYLDELIGCNYLPTYGFIKFYLGSKIKDNIFLAKIKYEKNIKKNIKNIILKKYRKYIIINKKYSLPLSYMRNLYIEKNLATLAINNDPVINNNEKFSDKYLFGYQTYYEKDPIKVINEIPEQKSDDWIVILTLDPTYIFFKKNLTKEMISFVIKKADLKKLNFNNVYAIYNDNPNIDF